MADRASTWMSAAPIGSESTTARRDSSPIAQLLTTAFAEKEVERTGHPGEVANSARAIPSSTSNGGYGTIRKLHSSRQEERSRFARTHTQSHRRPTAGITLAPSLGAIGDRLLDQPCASIAAERIWLTLALVPWSSEGARPSRRFARHTSSPSPSYPLPDDNLVSNHSA